MYDVREGYKIAYSYEDIANILYGKPAMIVNNICILFYLFSCQMSYMTLIKVRPPTSLEKIICYIIIKGYLSTNYHWLWPSIKSWVYNWRKMVFSRRILFNVDSFANFGTSRYAFYYILSNKQQFNIKFYSKSYKIIQDVPKESIFLVLQAALEWLPWQRSFLL